jgi:cell division protein FtsA
VFLEIKNYGHEESKKKLIAGIVLTGGGAELKHIKQLVEYVTGMDTRIGYPNENLAGDSDESLSSPQYATAVGLLMNGLNKIEKAKKVKMTQQHFQEKPKTEEVKAGAEKETIIEEEFKEPKKSIFEKWGDKFRDFLDNAE